MPPGTRSDEPITGVDLYPTLCAITGVRLPAEQKLDGESLLPLFQGQERSGPTRALFWHLPCYLQSYAVWGEQRDPLFRTRPCSVVRLRDWKLHEFFEDGAVELYNLREDLGETTDLQSMYPAKRCLVGIPRLPVRELGATSILVAYGVAASNGEWAARNRLNSCHSGLSVRHGGKAIVYKSRPGHVHTFRRLVHPDNNFERNPEYFALIDGKRTRHGQLCLTNPDVLAHVIGGIRNRLPQQRTEAGVNVGSVSQNDGQTSYCRCDKYARLAEHEGSQSGPIIHFVNQVADDIKDDYLGLFIETLAYGYTHSPPRDVKARDNVLVRLCSGGGYFKVIAPGGGFHLRYHPFSDGTSANDDLIVKWSKVFKNLHAWYYDLDDEHYLLPRPNLYSIQPNIRFYVDHNVTGIFV